VIERNSTLLPPLQLQSSAAVTRAQDKIREEMRTDTFRGPISRVRGQGAAVTLDVQYACPLRMVPHADQLQDADRWPPSAQEWRPVSSWSLGCNGNTIRGEQWVQREYHQRGAVGVRVDLPSRYPLSPPVAHLHIAGFPFGCSTHTHTHTQHLRQLRGTTDLPQQLHITPLKSWLIDNGCNVIVPFLGSSFLLNIKSRVRSMEQIVRSSIALQLERFKVPQDWL
jgi:hypothetical protein